MASICRLLDNAVVVLTSGAGARAREHDRHYPFPVHRRRGVLLPTRAVTSHAVRLLRQSGATRVVFGAAAPLSLMAPALRRAGAEHLVGLTHGHEIWWAALPGSRQLLRRMAIGVDHLATISGYTSNRIGPALTRAARQRMILLPPPVNVDHFCPVPEAVRLGRCLAAGRLVAQKGFDTLIDAWAMVMNDPAFLADDHVGANSPELMLIGDGPRRSTLQRQAARLGVSSSVHFIGAVSHDQMAGWLRTAQVFALPVRTRFAGLNPEGLGLTFLEAAASGVPVIVGRSGGAPETIIPRKTGFVVPSRNARKLAERLSTLLANPDQASAMGAAGRQFVSQHYADAAAATTLKRVLDLP